MKLILTEEVPNLGSPGDIVVVKDGYGRNFLLPRGFAIAWTKGGEKQVVQIKRARKAREVRDLDHAQEIKAALEAITITVPAKAGDAGRLFGSVTAADVALAVTKCGGPAVDKKAVELRAAVKTTGAHKASIKLHPGVTASVTFEVVPA